MPRQYTSPLREARARQTRRAIVEAAFLLFLEKGYDETSIREIATAAGVAERTVYTSFNDKPSILNAIADHAYFGGTREGEGEAEFLASLVAIEDAEERLRVAVHQQAVALEQGLAALARMVMAAAHSDRRLRAFVEVLLERRHRDTRTYTEAIIGRALPLDSTHERMIDELEAITSEEVYWILVVEREWTREDYEEYLHDMFIAILDRHGLELGEGARGR